MQAAYQERQSLQQPTAQTKILIDCYHYKLKKMMMLFKTVLLLSWAANNECNAFVPSILVPRRDLLQTHLSKNNLATTKSEAKVKHCIPLQEIGLDDLPKVGGKSLISIALSLLVCVASCCIASLNYSQFSLLQGRRPH